MKKEKNPCFGCVEPKRHVGCHGTCEEYKDFRKQLDAENEKIRTEKLKDEEFTAFREAAHDRMRQWDRKGKH